MKVDVRYRRGAHEVRRRSDETYMAGEKNILDAVAEEMGGLSVAHSDVGTTIGLVVRADAASDGGRS